MKVSIGPAAQELGVHPDTLRRGEKTGKIEVERTPTGCRRHDLAKLRGLAPHGAPSARTTLLCARVCSHDQQDHIARQAALLESFAAANGWTYEVLRDPGSGRNYGRTRSRKLSRIVSAGCARPCGRDWSFVSGRDVPAWKRSTPRTPVRRVPIRRAGTFTGTTGTGTGFTACIAGGMVTRTLLPP